MTPENILELYYSGKTIKIISEEIGLSVGKVYYLLRDAGCRFRRRGVPEGWKPTELHIQKIKKARTGMKFNPEWCKNISKARTCIYNGLNGYGHTKTHPNGYVLAYAPMHPNAHKDGYVMEHTIVIERELGRYLTTDEVVHHKNGVRSDNRIENLKLMNKHDHQSMHMRMRYKKEE